MRQHTMRTAMGAVIVAMTTALAAAQPAAAQEGQAYKIDPAHTSVYFKIGHADISEVYGRFNKVDGDFATGEAPHFNFTVQAQSIDTGNQKRDDHLRSPDFFNVKQFPVITFTSTDVVETDQGYDVTGDLTLHGVTKSITVPVVAGGETEFPPGTPRAGFTTTFPLKRSDFGMDNMLNVVGDEVTMMIGFEGVRKEE